MKCRWLRRLLPALMLVTVAGPVSAQPSAWWKSSQIRRDLGLTTEQINRLEAIFQAALPNLRQAKDELDKLEAELSRLIENDSDDATLTKQVDRVEATRSRMNKTRTLMLVHMREVLTPEQRAKFKALHERRDRRGDERNRDRRRPPL